MGAPDQNHDDKVWSDTVRREATPDRDELARPPALSAQRVRDMRPAGMQFGVSIALGVAGLVLVFVVGVTFVQWRAQAAAQETLRLNQEAQRQAQVQIEQMQREALARQAQLEAEQQREEER